MSDGSEAVPLTHHLWVAGFGSDQLHVPSSLGTLCAGWSGCTQATVLHSYQTLHKIRRRQVTWALGQLYLRPGPLALVWLSVAWLDTLSLEAVVAIDPIGSHRAINRHRNEPHFGMGGREVCARTPEIDVYWQGRRLASPRRGATLITPNDIPIYAATTKHIRAWPKELAPQIYSLRLWNGRNRIIKH